MSKVRLQALLLTEAEYIPVGVSAEKLVGLEITGYIWYSPTDTFKMWINTLDYTLIIPDQTI